ncbi:uncharacterized protein LOC135431884 [Drosophila montana]|uniref:uncharacterized protein LOC135431884 n=1 Tax=Drosophila montana TaxID=40370 RepID=UPI00313DE4DE
MFNTKTQAHNLGLMLLQQLLLLLLLVAAVSVDAGALRPRRDVSHLPLEYLPPVVLPPLPSRDYLPPVEQHAASLAHVLNPPRDYLPPVEAVQPGNEYLPPAPLEQLSESTATTTSTTELPTTEAVPTTNPTTEQPAAVETEAPVVEPETHEDIVEPAGVLHADGYHYAAPDIIPDLTPTTAPVEAYLPPLDDNAVVAEELPESEESAALLDDGYHYRAIRRLRF